MTKLATPAIENVGKDDGNSTNKGETTNDHVYNVADMADTLLLKGGGGVGNVVSLDEADGRIMVMYRPLFPDGGVE